MLSCGSSESLLVLKYLASIETLGLPTDDELEFFNGAMKIV